MSSGKAAKGSEVLAEGRAGAKGAPAGSVRDGAGEPGNLRSHTDCGREGWTLSWARGLLRSDFIRGMSWPDLQRAAWLL